MASEMQCPEVDLLMQEQHKNAGGAGIADACPENILLMQLAWRDCLLWSIGSNDPDFMAAFTKETGLHFPAAAKSPLEAMIDQATRMNEGIAAAYVKWFNANVWGSSGAVATEMTRIEKIQMGRHGK